VLAIVQQVLAPRHLIGGHVHADTDVWIHVLEGEVGVRVGDEEAIGRPGDHLLKPRGIPHAMWNPGDQPNRLLEILTPGEGDRFFRDAKELSADATREEFEEMCARHGITFIAGWDQDLKDRYGLR
jgi:quercetin dioxygenase-like cupin family protein